MIAFLVCACTPAPQKHQTRLEYYRVRQCYGKHCDQLHRYGATVTKTQKLNPLERCEKKECDYLKEFGPNGLPILDELRIQFGEPRFR